MIYNKPLRSYCTALPLKLQFDALLGLLTGRELLTLFARLRGVPEEQIKEVVEIEINRLDLKKHADKRSDKYRFVKYCKLF